MTEIESWLRRLDAAFTARNIAGVQDLFADECYWRDLVAFTWNITPHSGRAAIVDGLIEVQPQTRACKFGLPPNRTPPRRVKRIGTEVIEAIFQFETEHGVGHGVVRLLASQPNKAWVLMTSLDELKGHEEPIYARRPAGSAYSRSFGGENWADRRKREQAFSDREPTVLIVGAGTGTDVAIALSEGVKHVDAVEIDPRLQQIGAQQHPNHPYQDPRVSVHIDDGRAFLERSNTKYDLILFALPDSLTLVSGQSSLRLESYLFTLQAMQTAKAHLKPTGAFAMYNYYREDWLVDRLAGTLQSTYGHAPCLYTSGDVNRLAVLTVAPITNHAACSSPWKPTDAAAAGSPSTDDYPFLYLRTPGLPSIYLITLVLILLASIVAVRWIVGPFRRMGSYLDLFFMGSAFLLLETKSVVQFALLFGTTWFVNALVFAGVLIAVLLAIEVSRRVRLPKPIYLYSLLLAALVLAWLIPPDSLLSLDSGPRFAVAVAVYFAPIFLANLVFAERFRNVEESNVAFGANLLGAMVGGILEYLALITGYQALLIVVAVLYGLAFASRFATLPAWARLPAGARNVAGSPE